MTNAYTSVELTTNVAGIGYTLKHRNAVKLLIEYFCKRAINKPCPEGRAFTKEDYAIMMHRGKCHDMDKILCGLSYPQLTSDYLHRMFNGHHEESMIEAEYKSMYDWIEMIFDMESNKYTKPDKRSSSAYSFMCTYKNHIRHYVEPWFIFFELNKEDTGFIEEIKNQVNRKFYEKDLVDAIVEYIHTTHLHLLDGLARIDDNGYMRYYNAPVPFRHRSTQHPGGLEHYRPNQMAQYSRSVMSKEMIKGTFEAQIYDLDKICNIPAGQIDSLNKQALNAVGTLTANNCQR